MPEGIAGGVLSSALVEIVHRVRNRWRMRLALKGAVIVVAGTLTALFLSASSLEALKFSTASIIAFRLAAFLVFAGLVWYSLVLPLRRRVTDSQVALYLEEHDPTLQSAILSAVESSAMLGQGPDSDKGPSPQLIERLIEQAVERCSAIDLRLGMEREKVRRDILTLAGVAAVALLLLVFGPAFLRQGLSAMLVFYRSAEAASPYHIDVQPGDAKVPRGSDQTITAKLDGFQASDATLMVRNDPSAKFESLPLTLAKDAGAFEGLLFHVDKQTEYYVESNGVQSRHYTMEVLDLPTVQNLVLEYHFPAYTGLEPRTIDPGGDVAAIQGTEVRLRITPTMKSNGGSLILNDGAAGALTTQEDGTLVGSFTVDKQGFYRIELVGPHNEQVKASPQYTIDVLSDLTPSVRFSKPGRDTQATPVEEVFAEVKADDDFGVKNLQMFYSVNGGAEKTIGLFGALREPQGGVSSSNPGSKALPEVTASHTIYLEELNLTPGDFVSYYAKATDNSGAQGQTTTSDIYFVQIRPFRKDYSRAESAGGGGGGGGGNQVGQLSQQQREIVAATFNIVRDKAKMTAEKFRENTVFLTLAQAKLREQVEELSGKMNSRLDEVDAAFKKIAEAMPKAAAEMKTAEGNLKQLQAKEALSPEQRALKLLQDAEQEYEVQVSMQRGGGGGGGGGQSQMSEDLADLFELELDKLANQYEVQQRAEAQGGDQQIDELANKLKELAQRQQQEAERQRRLAASNVNGGGSGDAQRQLAQELEEAARRLEQLQRDQPRQNLADAARQLRDAANAMRQAAANGAKDGGAQAAAALDKLRQAQQQLQKNQSGRGERDIQDAKRQADELAAEQKEIEAAVDDLNKAELGPQARRDRVTQLSERKDQLDSGVGDLKSEIEGLANDLRKDQKDAARKLDEAAGSITDKRVQEKIRYTKNALRGSASEYARAMEDDISSNLDALKNKIGEAQSAFGNQSKEDALAGAAEKARDLARSLQSADQQMRDRAQQARNGQQGQGQQQGQQGQGQQGQQGQGQQGQQASNGQQGQGQQGQQGQGQQGQQGQGQQGQQGQGGQQGQQGQGGQGGQQQANGGGDFGGGNFGPYDGAYGGAYRNGYGYSGVWTPEDIRQWQRQAREWQADAEALRRQLTEAGVSTREFDQILRDLQQINNPQAFVDPANLAALQAQALDKMKKFEFDLRKKIEGGDQPLSLSASDAVPSQYRQAIEEYYRSLAKK